MSVAKFRDERELRKVGLQLDPVTGEVAAIPLAVVWKMTDEEFEAHAARFSAGDCATMIQEAKNQAIRCFKRGAEWYFTAGRWLRWARKKKAYGADGWEAFCRDECDISPSQAWKYMKFAELYSPEKIESSFGDERFSLEKALGYEDQDEKEDSPTERDDQTEEPANPSAGSPATEHEQIQSVGDKQPGSKTRAKKAKRGRRQGGHDGGENEPRDVTDERQKEFKESIRKLTPKTRAVAIHHALELLRDDLKGQEIDEELQETFGQIAQLAEGLKGQNHQDAAA